MREWAHARARACEHLSTPCAIRDADSLASLRTRAGGTAHSADGGEGSVKKKKKKKMRWRDMDEDTRKKKEAEAAERKRRFEAGIPVRACALMRTQTSRAQ